MTESITVSTGQTFELPVSLSATIAGAVFPADRAAVEELLPTGLEPVGTRADRAAMTVLVVRYDRVGRETIPPYDEVGVLFPAVEAGTRTVPYVSLLRRPASGYVHTLPVTTEPARAFGVDVWGYPKLVATIDVTDEGRTRRATVTTAEGTLLSVSIRRPPTVPARLSGYNFTIKDDKRLREPTTLRGRVGGWFGGKGASLSFGEHPTGRQLDDIGVGTEPLFRLAADCEFTIGAGEPLG
ncbi:Acetoacetate decarboxylase protein [Halorhabdus tiamatea SARL4B]|uniref:Acetoacetate decarboxylase n=1 Tax=Halorhabdus tiamatea SARL4B TaxID=1033806 RepID=F7PFE0_9EURY|nr:acetoacetate decarboxylase family protein [Halorhabdus tiamatea]ERJ06041.1 Acetoacetate decarboxylase protein [Halorhabdus tiamatea SARL4B]CCQ34398.1 acetoacetate decarboxylase [Halorhabdus tiamatea SARL4B]